MARTRKPPAASPEAVAITYDLFDLPTAQHKAGLAGLLLQIESMKNRNKAAPTYGWDEKEGSTKVHVSFTRETTESLFDDLYDAAWIEGAPREKPFFKGKGPARKEVSPIRRMQFTKTDKKGNEKAIDGYVYLELTPALATLRQYLPEQGEWVRLWRDLIRQVIRDSKKKAPFIERAAAKGQPDSASLAAVDDTDADSPGQEGEDGKGKGDGSTWADLLKHHASLVNNTFALGVLSSALLLGAQASNAEIIPFAGRIDQNLLLHFWPLTIMVYVPRFIDSDGNSYIGRRNKDDKSQHFCVAVPEVADLKAFLVDYPRMLTGLNTETAIYRPKESLIDLAAEGGISFIEHLARLAPQLARESEVGCSVSGVDYLHLNKDGNNVKFLTTGRVAFSPHLAEDYLGIVGRPGQKPPFGNPLFRRGLMLALLEDLPWHKPFGKLLAEWPWEFFCEKDDDPKTQRKWLARLFGADAARRFRELIKEQNDVNQDESPGKRQPRPVDLIVHDVAKQYVLRRAEAREPNLPKSEAGAVDWRHPKAQNAKADAARDAFLALRSRRDQAFIEHFTGLFGQFGQYLPEQDFLSLADALHEDTDRVKTIALLALSANGYVFGKQESQTTEETSA